MPKVSVIIPVYGVEKYIERCARSLFEQTIDDIEYIFVNDCTKDRSIEILEQVIKEYPQRKGQIRIENMSTNSGQAAVRRFGIELATGEYIIHCDSDDWVDLTMYELLYNKAKLENADIVTCDYYISDCRNHILQNCKWTSNLNFLSDLIAQRIAVSLCNKLIKKEKYKSIIYPIHNMGEDYAIVVQLAINSEKIVHVSNPLYYYYKNSNSISNNPEVKHIANKWIGLNKNILLISDILKKHNLYNKYKSEIESKIYEFKDLIIPYIVYDRKYRKIWLNLYPNLNFWDEKGFKHKVRYLIIFLGLYPLMRKIRGIK